MLLTIREDHSPCNGYTLHRFRIHWCVNGVVKSKNWAFNDTNKEEQRAKAEAFRAEMLAIARTQPIKTHIQDIPAQNRFVLSWRDHDGTKHLKAFRYARKGRAAVLADVEAFRAQIMAS